MIKGPNVGAKRYLIPVILGLLIVAVAAKVKWWLPLALEFSGANKDAITSLNILLQLILVPLGFVVTTIGVWLAWRSVTKDPKQIINPGVLAVPPTPQLTPPVPTPPEPYFAHPYPLQENFTGRIGERAMLTQWLVADDRPVLALTAIGGMGKSALTWAWIQRDVLGLPLPGLSVEPTARVLEANRPIGVLWWSFYTTESRFSSFLERAISYVSGGNIDPASIQSGYEKALALVDLLQQNKILLVLDGFERELRAYASLMAAYQDEGAAETEGEDSRSCSDPAASTFLRGIAAGTLKGRVLLTSRLFPKELETLTGQCREHLTSMEPDDAVVFFQAQGVDGNPKSLRTLWLPSPCPAPPGRCDRRGPSEPRRYPGGRT